MLMTKVYNNIFFSYRPPNPDNVLIIKTPSGVFSSRKLTKPKEKKGGLRLIRKDAPVENPLPPLPSEEIEEEQEGCARCRVYKKKETKVREIIYMSILILHQKVEKMLHIFVHQCFRVLPKKSNVPFGDLVVDLHIVF